MGKNIFWSITYIQDQTFYIAVTNKGLCYLGNPNEAYSDMEKWLSTHFKDYSIIHHCDALQPYIEDIQAYTNKQRKTFNVPLDLQGTPFQMAVWQALQEIPYGETVSYSAVAEKIGKPTAVRAVGGAIGANPVMIVVPCHRVIGKNGQLTGFGGGLDMKSYLLKLENDKK